MRKRSQLHNWRATHRKVERSSRPCRLHHGTRGHAEASCRRSCRPPRCPDSVPVAAPRGVDCGASLRRLAAPTPGQRGSGRVGAALQDSADLARKSVAACVDVPFRMAGANCCCPCAPGQCRLSTIVSAVRANCLCRIVRGKSAAVGRVAYHRRPLTLRCPVRGLGGASCDACPSHRTALII